MIHYSCHNVHKDESYVESEFNQDRNMVVRDIVTPREFVPHADPFSQHSVVSPFCSTKCDLFCFWLDRGTSLEGFISKKLVGFKDTMKVSTGITGKSVSVLVANLMLMEMYLEHTFRTRDMGDTKCMPQNNIFMFHIFLTISPNG